MPEMRNVFSSHINRVGYDDDTHEMHVEFSNGSHVVYHDVPSHTATAVLTAPSIGEEMWRTLRGRFAFKYRHRRRARSRERIF